MSSKNALSITLEAIALAILTGGTYWVFLILMIRPLNTGVPITGDLPFSKIFLIALLVFDAVWLVTIKFWPLKNIHFKILLTLLLFAFTAAVVTLHTMPTSFGF
jgi:hypothetical protein